MLYLTVGQDDKIFIGDGDDTIVIEVTRLRAGKDQMQVGINAPRDIPINTVFADASKQFKKRQGKKLGDAIQEAVEPAVSPDDVGNRKDYEGKTGNRSPQLPKIPKRTR